MSTEIIKKIVWQSADGDTAWNYALCPTHGVNMVSFQVQGGYQVASDCPAKGRATTSIERAEVGRRLIACWNACEGISTEDIEAVSVNTGPLLANKLAEVDALHAYTGQLQRQRDELLAVVHKARALIGDQRLRLEPYKDGFKLAQDPMPAVRVLESIDAAIVQAGAAPAIQHLPADEAGFKMAQHTLQTLQPMSPMRAKAILSARAAKVQHLPADDTEGGAQ